MNGDLFSHAENSLSHSPLAYRMRPRSLNEIVGQAKVLGPGRPLRTWIETDRLPSLILWGPPGCGKTTIAQVIAGTTQSHFASLSAVLSGVKDIKEAIERARETSRMYRRRTVLFVDEIHRFNKSQQDALLPHVEDGTVTLIGATTENPSFELNRALLSRTRVIRLEPLTEDELVGLLKRALSDSERGLGGTIQISDEALKWIAVTHDGDARRALTALDTVSLSHLESHSEDKAVFGVEEVRARLESAMDRQPIAYDKSGEEHYNVVSAFIKSMRASDPHASLYYLARMLEGGEDPVFICRRMVILASEDIGNADPRALSLALSAKDAVEFVGMPEARITLGHVVTYLALAPKSNAAYVGINEAIAEVRASGAIPTPMHLRNAVTGLMKDEGYGSGYQYAHNRPDSRVKARNLPERLSGRRFYRPTEAGLEKQLKEKLDRLNPDFE